MIAVGPTIRPYLYAALAFLVLGMVANTYRLSSAVDRAKLELVECQAANEKLTTALDEQNGAVKAWKAAAVANTARADAALAEVDRLAAARRQVQADLETWKRRAGENECEAARRMLLEYRK